MSFQREPLSRGRILESAVRLIDAQGLEALSMRSLGATLGVEAMSLYNHVPNKDAVLDGVMEVLLQEMELPLEDAEPFEALRGSARAFRKVLRAHPRALPLFATRPAVTQRALDYVERGLAVLRAAGFGRRERVFAFQALVTFTVGNALSQFGPGAAGPAYSTLPVDAFPRITESAVHLTESNLDAEFEFGLEALLAGFQKALDKSRRRRG